MALPPEAITDLRTLIAALVDELTDIGDPDATTIGSAPQINEARLANFQTRLDNFEARVRAMDQTGWDEHWAEAQDLTWQRVQARLPTFDLLIDDDRTKTLLKSIMRSLSLRRTKRMATG